MGTDGVVHLYVIRHGMTKSNKEKRYLGHSNENLLPEFIPELLSLKKQLSRVTLDQIFTSDLNRCLETAAFLVPDQSACADPKLREMDFGDWEGKNHHELQNAPAYQHWIDHWETSAPPNGEGYQSFKRRVILFLNEILDNKRKNLLVVTHGGVIREIMKEFIPFLSFGDTTIPHGGGVHMIFERDGGEWKCSSWSGVPIVEKENW